MISSNDQMRWQSAEENFRRTRFNYLNLKRKISSIFQRKETNDEKDHSNEESIDIHNICDQLAWNVLNNDTEVFLLTRYFISDEIICSINDITNETSYEHICQYGQLRIIIKYFSLIFVLKSLVLDFCFDNDICGKHGRCVNYLMSFKCSCYFYMDDPFCRQSKLSFFVYELFFNKLFSFENIYSTLNWFVYYPFCRCLDNSITS